MTEPPTTIRITHTVRTALHALAETDGLSGVDIIAATGLTPGALYPVLRRIEANGLATSEQRPSPIHGARPRSLYTLTDAGRAHPAVVEHLRAIGKATP